MNEGKQCEFYDEITGSCLRRSKEAKKIGRLAEALKKYGQHGITCTWSRLGGDPCTCGFEAVLKAAGEEVCMAGTWAADARQITGKPYRYYGYAIHYHGKERESCCGREHRSSETAMKCGQRMANRLNKAAGEEDRS